VCERRMAGALDAEEEEVAVRVEGRCDCRWWQWCGRRRTR
jgi:hypothetical protein